MSHNFLFLLSLVFKSSLVNVNIVSFKLQHWLDTLLQMLSLRCYTFYIYANPRIGYSSEFLSHIRKRKGWEAFKWYFDHIDSCLQGLKASCLERKKAKLFYIVLCVCVCVYMFNDSFGVCVCVFGVGFVVFWIARRPHWGLLIGLLLWAGLWGVYECDAVCVCICVWVCVYVWRGAMCLCEWGSVCIWQHLHMSMCACVGC